MWYSMDFQIFGTQEDYSQHPKPFGICANQRWKGQGSFKRQGGRLAQPLAAIGGRT